MDKLGAPASCVTDDVIQQHHDRLLPGTDVCVCLCAETSRFCFLLQREFVSVSVCVWEGSGGGWLVDLRFTRPPPASVCGVLYCTGLRHLRMLVALRRALGKSRPLSRLYPDAFSPSSRVYTHKLAA